ncbi:uncharacterized protein LOC136028989 [Artemia franciscana]
MRTLSLLFFVQCLLEVTSAIYIKSETTRCMLYQALDKQRKADEFTDVVFRTPDGKNFSAHRIVIAAESKQLQRLLRIAEQKAISQTSQNGGTGHTLVEDSELFDYDTYPEPDTDNILDRSSRVKRNSGLWPASGKLVQEVCKGIFDYKLYPHSTLCNKYIACVHGKSVERDCGPGTAFSPALQVCVRPKNAGCDRYNGTEVLHQGEAAPSIDVRARQESFNTKVENLKKEFGRRAEEQKEKMKKQFAFGAGKILGMLGNIGKQSRTESYFHEQGQGLQPLNQENLQTAMNQNQAQSQAFSGEDKFLEFDVSQQQQIPQRIQPDQITNLDIGQQIQKPYRLDMTQIEQSNANFNPQLLQQQPFRIQKQNIEEMDSGLLDFDLIPEPTEIDPVHEQKLPNFEETLDSQPKTPVELETVNILHAVLNSVGEKDIPNRGDMGVLNKATKIDKFCDCNKLVIDVPYSNETMTSILDYLYTGKANVEQIDSLVNSATDYGLDELIASALDENIDILNSSTVKRVVQKTREKIKRTETKTVIQKIFRKIKRRKDIKNYAKDFPAQFFVEYLEEGEKIPSTVTDEVLDWLHNAETSGIEVTKDELMMVLNMLDIERMNCTELKRVTDYLTDKKIRFDARGLFKKIANMSFKGIGNCMSSCVECGRQYAQQIKYNYQPTAWNISTNLIPQQTPGLETNLGTFRVGSELFTALLQRDTAPPAQYSCVDGLVIYRQPLQGAKGPAQQSEYDLELKISSKDEKSNDCSLTNRVRYVYDDATNIYKWNTKFDYNTPLEIDIKMNPVNK